MPLRTLLVIGVLALACLPAGVPAAPETADEPLQIAVAANFAGCLAELTAVWEQAGGTPVVASVGSSGRHYAQILAGAPYEIFLAADAERPAKLAAGGYTVDGKCLTYAIGRLVLWAPGLDLGDRNLDEILRDPQLRHLAVADARVAPYGRAAQQVLASLGLTGSFAGRLVTGRSVGQAWQFVASGAAPAGLVARSQIPGGDEHSRVVDESLHQPIEQQAVLLGGAAGRSDAVAFLRFLRSEEAGRILSAHGYAVAAQDAP